MEFCNPALTYLVIVIGQILQAFPQLGGCHVVEMRRIIGASPSLTSLRVHWHDGQALEINFIQTFQTFQTFKYLVRLPCSVRPGLTSKPEDEISRDFMLVTIDLSRNLSTDARPKNNKYIIIRQTAGRRLRRNPERYGEFANMTTIQKVLFY